MANTYTIGALVRIDLAFVDVNGVPTDPDTVELTITGPRPADIHAARAPVVLVYSEDDALVRDSAGNYHANVDADLLGLWKWYVKSTGTGQTASDGEFIVDE